MSSDRQEASIPDQRKHVEQYARENGYRIGREYIDEGISGDDTPRRVGFRHMVADAASGEWSVILAWDQDRFGRFDSIDAGEWIAPLRRAKVRLETVAQGPIDWNDFAGRMVFAIQQEAKHAYLRDLSRNVLRGHITNALEGGRRAGVPPLGYDADGDELVPNADAETVRLIFRETLAGKSLRALARELGTTRRGTRWSAGAVKVVLNNPVYRGAYVWGRRKSGKYHRFTGGRIEPAASGAKDKVDAADAVLIEGRYPALVPAAEWHAAQDRLKANRTATAPRPTFSLSGLVWCGHCGGKMHGQTMWGHRYYLCVNRGKGCRYYSVRESELEQVVLEKVAAQIGTKESRATLRREYERQLRARLAASDVKADRKRLAALDAKLSAAGARLLEVDAELLPLAQEQARRLKAERDELAARVADAESAESRLSHALAEQVKAIDGWADGLLLLAAAPPASRRTYFRDLLESATAEWQTGGTDRLARHHLRRVTLTFRHPIVGDL